MKLIVLEGGRAKVLTPEQILAKAARAAGMPDSEFDPQAVARGAKIEMEHTDDPAKARKIAKDHLAEDPRYYTALSEMESKLEETKPMKKADLSPQKARKILHDKQVHGHPLTDKQRRYMGAVSSGSAQKSQKAEEPEGAVRERALEAVDTAAKNPPPPPPPPQAGPGGPGGPGGAPGGTPPGMAKSVEEMSPVEAALADMRDAGRSSRMSKAFPPKRPGPPKPPGPPQPPGLKGPPQPPGPPKPAQPAKPPMPGMSAPPAQPAQPAGPAQSAQPTPPGAIPAAQPPVPQVPGGSAGMPKPPIPPATSTIPGMPTVTPIGVHGGMKPSGVSSQEAVDERFNDTREFLNKYVSTLPKDHWALIDSLRERGHHDLANAHEALMRHKIDGDVGHLHKVTGHLREHYYGNGEGGGQGDLAVGEHPHEGGPAADKPAGEMDPHLDGEQKVPEVRTNAKQGEVGETEGTEVPQNAQPHEGDEGAEFHTDMGLTPHEGPGGKAELAPPDATKAPPAHEQGDVGDHIPPKAPMKPKASVEANAPPSKGEPPAGPFPAKPKPGKDEDEGEFPPKKGKPPFQKSMRKAEGERGGKVIGHTQTGKPIYESHAHPSHAQFTPQEHGEAVQAHRAASSAAFKQYHSAQDWKTKQAANEKLRAHGVAVRHHSQFTGKPMMFSKQPKGLKALEDYLEKARHVTPVGGITPGGYRKVTETQYVKEEPGAGKQLGLFGGEAKPEAPKPAAPAAPAAPKARPEHMAQTTAYNKEIDAAVKVGHHPSHIAALHGKAMAFHQKTAFELAKEGNHGAAKFHQDKARHHDEQAAQWGEKSHQRGKGVEKLQGYFKTRREHGADRMGLGEIMADTGMNLEQTQAALDDLGYTTEHREGGDPRGFIHIGDKRKPEVSLADYKGHKIEATPGAVQVGRPGKKPRKIGGFEVTEPDGYKRHFDTKREAKAWVDANAGEGTSASTEKPGAGIEALKEYAEKPTGKGKDYPLYDEKAAQAHTKAAEQAEKEGDHEKAADHRVMAGHYRGEGPTAEEARKVGGYHEEGGVKYIDTDFINHASAAAKAAGYPDAEVKHLGFGEFDLDLGDGKTISFARRDPKQIEGFSGRAHAMSGDQEAIKKILGVMGHDSRSLEEKVQAKVKEKYQTPEAEKPGWEPLKPGTQTDVDMEAHRRKEAPKKTLRGRMKPLEPTTGEAVNAELQTLLRHDGGIPTRQSVRATMDSVTGRYPRLSKKDRGAVLGEVKRLWHEYQKIAKRLQGRYYQTGGKKVGFDRVLDARVVRDQLNSTRKWMTVTVKAELDKPGGGVYGTTKPVTAQGLSPDHIDRMVRRMGHVAGSDEREKLPKSQEDKVAAVRRAYQEVLDSNEDNSGFKDVSLIATLNRAARIAAIHSIYGDIEPGWAKEGEKAKSEEVKKSGIAELNDFLSRDTEDRTMRKADQDQTQGMPEGDQKDFPQMDAAGGSLEDGEKPTTVKKGEKSAPIDFQDTVGAAPKAKQDALSDDEEEDEDQMEPHKKPIEESLKSLTPARQRDLTAKDRAAKIAQLRKSRDITLHPYSDARIHAGVEDVIERRLNKSETYVEDPSLVPGLPLIAQGVLCKSCGHKHTAAVTACPHCGSGVTISQVVPGVAASGPVGVLQKSAAHVLRPAKRESDLRFDGGNVPLKE